VDGISLTIAEVKPTSFVTWIIPHTRRYTNLKNAHAGDLVNLERATVANERFGGHFVQGHIDCVSPILAFEASGADFRLEIELPPEFANFIASKGSIAVNGISLTVAEIFPKSFAVWIVPYTKQHTNLNRAETGDLVNLEFDVLAKYVERMLRHAS